jgi:UDP:flavonoid glycosyltransferase YjiC (YdhE family)
MITPHSYDSRFMKPTTLCRCNHILECCADCTAWLVENSPRIANQWRWWLEFGHRNPFTVALTGTVDWAEADDLAYWRLTR